MSTNWDGQQQNSHVMNAQACASQLGYPADVMPERPDPAEVLAARLAELRDLDAAVGKLVALIDWSSNHVVAGACAEAVRKAVEPLRVKMAMAVVEAADEATR